MQLFPVPDLPLIQPGDDLAALLLERLLTAGQAFQTGDILVVAQKIISKAEGRLVRLNDVTPSAEALQVAQVCGEGPACGAGGAR